MRLCLLQRLNDLARHRTDISPTMAANFGFISHAAKRHPDEFTPRCLGNRLAKRGFADTRRADKAQDGARQFISALLNGQIFNNPLLDLLQTEMISIEQGLRAGKVLLDLRALAPWQRQHPVEIIADNRCLSRHRRHLAQLLQFRKRLFARFLRKLGLVDPVFELAEFVLAFLVAEFLLDRLHLLVEVIFALGLLHLALDARADALFDLQDGDFALHESQHLFKALHHIGEIKHVLLIRNLDGQMRSDRIRKLRIIFNLRNSGNDFR